MASFKLDYLCKDLISKQGYILKYRGLEFLNSIYISKFI